MNLPGRPLSPLSATPDERQRLTELAEGGNPRLARRAAIVLACIDGVSNRSIAARFRMSKQAVGKWRARFHRMRVGGLLDQPRSGAPRRINPEDVARVIAMTRQPPPPGLARWTTRAMARSCGLSQTTVNRIWRMHGLAPHRAAAEPVPTGPDPVAMPDRPVAREVVPRGTPSNTALIAELRRDLAGLAQMLHAANPTALRVAVDAVEAAFVAATGSADVHRRHGAALAPEIRARHEARWRRARAAFAEAKATLGVAPADLPASPTPAAGENARPRR
jgi:transposase